MGTMEPASQSVCHCQAGTVGKGLEGGHCDTWTRGGLLFWLDFLGAASRVPGEVGDLPALGFSGALLGTG